jgi:hypothetical protein
MRCFHRLVSGLVNGGPKFSHFLRYGVFLFCVLFAGLVYMDRIWMDTLNIGCDLVCPGSEQQNQVVNSKLRAQIPT